MKIALVESGVVTRVIIGELADFPGYIDVTGVYIGEGFTDNGDGTFTAPPPPTPPAIRKITSQAFYRRLAVNERRALRDGTTDEIADMREDLSRSPIVDLDGTIEAQLLSVGTSQARVDELLVDGTEAETSTG